MSWTLRDDRAELRELRHLLDRLELLFARERRAIGRLDGDELLAVTAEKEQVVLELQALAEATDAAEATDGSALVRVEDEEVRCLRDDIRRAAEKMVAEAQANSALLSDAADSVAAALGVRDPAGTYDRRARRKSTLRGLMAKAV